MTRNRTSTPQDDSWNRRQEAKQSILLASPGVNSIFVTIGIVVIGCCVLAVGIWLLLDSWNTLDCQLSYSGPKPYQTLPSEPPQSTDLIIDRSACNKANDVIEAPSYLYYELRGFYHSSRRFWMSQNHQQLKGQVVTDLDLLAQTCGSFLFNSRGEIMVPCGAVARSVFNDSYSIVDASGKAVTLDETAEKLLWPKAESNLKNPPTDPIEIMTDTGNETLHFDPWLPQSVFPGQIENAHFIVWITSAKLPKFRKLYGVINEDLRLPITVKVRNRWPEEYYGAHKAIVLSRVSRFGGRAVGSAVATIVLGALSVLAVIALCVQQRRDSQVIDDARTLKYS